MTELGGRSLPADVRAEPRESSQLLRPRLLPSVARSLGSEFINRLDKHLHIPELTEQSTGITKRNVLFAVGFVAEILAH